MRDAEIGEPVVDALIELVDAKAHELRECLGALQLARSPDSERSAVNLAIGLLARVKIQLRSGRAAVNLSEEWSVAGMLSVDVADPENRVKHAALALLDVEIRALDAAGVEVVHEFSATPV